MIQSVERAFSLLYTIGLNEDHASISQLARDVELPRTTVVRLLETLQGVGAVRASDDGDEYQLGEKLIALLNMTAWNDQIVAIAQPCLQTLAAQTGETAYLCLPDGDWCYFAAQINSRYKIRVEDSTGERHPLHVTSAGKLFLANRSLQAQQKYFGKELERYTEYSLTTPDTLQSLFPHILETKVSWTRDEYEIGYVSVAAPIFNKHGEVAGAPALGAPKFRIRDAEHEEEWARLVLETAEKISLRLK